MIDAKRVEEMKRLTVDATGGNWNVTEDNFVDNEDSAEDCYYLVTAHSRNDAQFIAKSRQFVPDIIAAYEKQAAEIDKLRMDLRCSSDVQTGVIKKQAEEITELRKALDNIQRDAALLYEYSASKN